MAIKANLVMDQGSDFSAVIDLSDSAGAVYNLIGYSAAAQMRKNYASTTAYTFITITSGITGRVSLTLGNEITNDIEPGRYMYDVEITSASGNKNRVVEGIVTVNPGITRV
jgi:hypothetical protein|tara:strand:- start:75 stop:407 length:333 start_codon:yes stop_codon:yes gene_type:complete